MSQMCYDFVFIIVFNFWYEFIDSFRGYDRDFIINKRCVQIYFFFSIYYFVQMIFKILKLRELLLLYKLWLYLVMIIT